MLPIRKLTACGTTLTGPSLTRSMSLSSSTLIRSLPIFSLGNSSFWNLMPLPAGKFPLQISPLSNPRNVHLTPPPLPLASFLLRPRLFPPNSPPPLPHQFPSLPHHPPSFTPSPL